MNDRVLSTEITTYNDCPVLDLEPEERYGFSFGYSKARLVLEHFESIQQFVQRWNFFQSTYEKEHGGNAWPYALQKLIECNAPDGVQFTQYKGNPIIKLSDDFQFGLGKAQKIIDRIDAIRKFVELADPVMKNGKPLKDIAGYHIDATGQADKEDNTDEQGGIPF